MFISLDAVVGTRARLVGCRQLDNDIASVVSAGRATGMGVKHTLAVAVLATITPHTEILFAGFPRCGMVFICHLNTDNTRLNLLAVGIEDVVFVFIAYETAVIVFLASAVIASPIVVATGLRTGIGATLVLVVAHHVGKTGQNTITRRIGCSTVGGGGNHLVMINVQIGTIVHAILVVSVAASSSQPVVVQSSADR